MNDFNCEYYVNNKLNCKNDIDMLSICPIYPTFNNAFVKIFLETLRHHFKQILQYLNIYSKKTN